MIRIDDKLEGKGMKSHVTKFVTGTIMSQFITLVAGILGRRFLGPLNMGIWSLLQVVLNYAHYTSFGAMNATLREIPYYEGKQDRTKVEKIQNVSFSFSMLTAFVVAFLLLTYAFLMKDRISEVMFVGLLFSSGLIILGRMNDLLITFLRAYKQFGFASRQMVMSAVVNSLLIIILSYYFKFYGYVAAMIVSFVFNIAYIMFRQKFKFRLVLDINQVKDLVGYGMPLVLLGVMSTVFLSIDKIMIANLLGLRELGLYSVAVMSYRYLSTFPNAVGNVLVPNLHEKYGKYDDKKKLEGTLSRTALLLSNVSPLLIGVVWFLLPVAVSVCLPEFRGCIPAAKYLTLGSFFLAINNPYSYYMVAIKKHFQMFPIMLGASLVAVVVNYIAIKNNFGIMGVAFGTSFVLFVKFAMTYFLASTSLVGEYIALRDLIRIVCKFVFMVVVLVVVQKVVPGPDDSFVLSVTRILLAEVLFIPLIVKLEREFGIFRAIAEKFLGRAVKVCG